ncbi:unnamed protein product, partial [Prorocentrum cordatum]
GKIETPSLLLRNLEYQLRSFPGKEQRQSRVGACPALLSREAPSTCIMRRNAAPPSAESANPGPPASGATSRKRPGMAKLAARAETKIGKQWPKPVALKATTSLVSYSAPRYVPSKYLSTPTALESRTASTPTALDHFRKPNDLAQERGQQIATTAMAASLWESPRRWRKEQTCRPGCRGSLRARWDRPRGLPW